MLHDVASYATSNMSQSDVLATCPRGAIENVRYAILELVEVKKYSLSQEIKVKGSIRVHRRYEIIGYF